MIEVDRLSKTFLYHTKREGLLGSLGNLFHRPTLRKDAVQEVSFRIERGEIVGLLGPNGAGKSSLMRTIATLQDPDSGTIRFGDLDVLAKPDELRRVLGYLPQEFGLYPNLSAEAILEHFAVLKGITVRRERNAQVGALLEQTNLAAVRKKSVGGFSGGMKQRLGIAIALLGRPRLVIVDEPTAGLDPTERHRFLNLLGEIGEDVVVILSTHIVEDVAELCPNFAIIAGRGERRETVEALLRQVNLWDVRKKAIAGFSGGMRQRFGIAQALIGNPRLIIVDEPTAGLDPEERNRFNNLLAEIGENVVVILSTHIVDDVTDLCPRMAILVGGRIVLAGTPSELIAALQGHIWQASIEKHELEAAKARHPVIATRLRSGRTVIRVLADSSPGVGFAPVEAGLEDVYFATLHRHRAAEPAAAALKAA